MSFLGGKKEPQKAVQLQPAKKDKQNIAGDQLSVKTGNKPWSSSAVSSLDPGTGHRFQKLLLLESMVKILQMIGTSQWTASQYSKPKSG